MTEGNESPLTETQRIIIDAVKYSRFNHNGDVVEGAEYRGYIAGATAERELMKQQLKEERNKAIDECIEIFTHNGQGYLTDIVIKVEKLKV